ncbi:MAG TPA: hypothetical protein VGG09_13955 [Acidimicrobiales bacterium]|jgi:hypothetical protein
MFVNAWARPCCGFPMSAAWGPMADRVLSAVPVEFRLGLAYELGDLAARHHEQRHHGDTDGQDHQWYQNLENVHDDFTTFGFSRPFTRLPPAATTKRMRRHTPPSSRFSALPAARHAG